jgi:hypothetical protein
MPELYAYWKHRYSGDVYAVRMVPVGKEDVQVTGVCGPLSHREYLMDPAKPSSYDVELLGAFNYVAHVPDNTATGALWIEDVAGEFDQVADSREINVRVRANPNAFPPPPEETRDV